MLTPTRLLQLLLALLASHGFGPEGLDPWRGWVLFKQFARATTEFPDPGVSVQISPDPEVGEVSLVFLRQIVAPNGDWLEPEGGVVCEFVYQGDKFFPESDLWSIDLPTFSHLVDAVERDPTFTDLIAKIPRRTAVYWLDA